MNCDPIEERVGLQTNEPSVEARIRDLDQALLFLSSFAAFVLAIVLNLAFKPTLIQFLALFPLLLIVVIMPLYVGYMRGVVEQGSITERARGWVYLLFGFGFYSLTLIESPFAFGSDQALKFLGLIVVVTTLFALAIFTKRFVSWFYRTLGYAQVPLRDKIGIHGVISGILVSSLFYEAVLTIPLGTTLNNAPFVYDTLTGQLVSIGEGVFFLFPLILFELKSHHCLTEAAKRFERREAKFRLKPGVPKWIASFANLVYMDLFLWASGSGVKGFNSLLIVSTSIILAGVFLAGVLSWVGVLTLFSGDIILFLSLYIHVRQIWRAPKT